MASDIFIVCDMAVHSLLPTHYMPLAFCPILSACVHFCVSLPCNVVASVQDNQTSACVLDIATLKMCTFVMG